jgi:hypothetical protein
MEAICRQILIERGDTIDKKDPETKENGKLLASID